MRQSTLLFCIILITGCEKDIQKLCPGNDLLVIAEQVGGSFTSVGVTDNSQVPPIELYQFGARNAAFYHSLDPDSDTSDNKLYIYEMHALNSDNTVLLSLFHIAVLNEDECQSQRMLRFTPEDANTRPHSVREWKVTLRFTTIRTRRPRQ